MKLVVLKALSLLSGVGAKASQIGFSPLFWPEMPYILTVSRAVVFKNVFLFPQELLLL